MRNYISKITALLLLTNIVLAKLSAQQSPPQTSSRSQETNEMLDYLLRLSRPGININRMPINICFLRDRNFYVGFVIAGHATKDVCSVATLRVVNLLDSMGYEENTVFSYGVGYDRLGSRDPLLYHQKLRELRNAFLDLEDEYSFEVRVIDAQD